MTAASPTRHLLVLLAAGAVAGGGSLLVRRVRASGGGEVSEALWLRGGRLELLLSLIRGTLSIVTVGMGASLGREAAPQLAGAALASELCERSAAITPAQRRLLVAAGAGAGMAAVYNVPLGGALFALEVLLGTLALPLVLPALLTSLIATAVAWIVIPTHGTYLVATYGVSAAQIVWAALVGPLAGLTAVAWVRLINRANRGRPTGTRNRVVAPNAVFTALGALAIQYPQLLGNGKELSQLAFVGDLSVGLPAVLLIAKPLVTAACLGSGSPGGAVHPDRRPGRAVRPAARPRLERVVAGIGAGKLRAVWRRRRLGGGDARAACSDRAHARTDPQHGLPRRPLLLAAGEATVVARLLRTPSIYSAGLVQLDASPTPQAPTRFGVGAPP